MTRTNEELMALKRLYLSADRIWDIAPWNFMFEDQLFCMMLPDNQTTYFISVMGSGGEHVAVSVYQGIEEYWKFFDLLNNATAGNPGKILEIGQLQVSFENQSYIEKEDIAIIKELGHGYNDPKRFPLFRSFRDGYFPWYLEPEEVRLLSTILELAADIFLRIQSGFELPDDLEDKFFLRYGELHNGEIIWKEKIIEVDFPPEIIPAYQPDEKLLKKIQSLPESNHLFEFDYSLLLNPIQDNKSLRPYYGTMALLVDHRTGMVLGSDIFGDRCNSSQRLMKAPGVLLKLLSQQKARPKGIDLVRPELNEMMDPVFERLGIRIRLADELPMLDEAREALQENLRRKR
jgi:hypothetical protein